MGRTKHYARTSTLTTDPTREGAKDSNDALKKIIEEEDNLREAVVTGRREELKTNTTFAKNVFGMPSGQVSFLPEPPEEAAIPHLFTSYSKATSGPQLLTDRSQFEQRFASFTGNLLAGLNWDNVVAAGGSVLASATTASNADQLFATADVDLFFHGLRNDDEANAKLREVYAVVKRNTRGGEPLVLRTGRAVSFVGMYPTRTVQVILRLYSCPAEVLLGFDVDCCALAYDGQKLLASDRALHAVRHQVNVVNTSRRSHTYEMRLFKYAKRGFSVVLPGVDLARIDDRAVRLAFHRLHSCSGLMKLLAFEMHGEFSLSRAYVRGMRRLLGMALPGRTEFDFDTKLDVLGVNETPSDYSALVVPWGPKWTAARIRQVLEHRDRSEFFSGEADKKRAGAAGAAGKHVHCFVTGLEEAIGGIGTSAWCMRCKRRESLCGDDAKGRYVAGPLTWERELACFQDFENGRTKLATGSFNVSLAQPYDLGVYLPAGKPNPTGFFTRPKAAKGVSFGGARPTLPCAPLGGSAFITGAAVAGCSGLSPAPQPPRPTVTTMAPAAPTATTTALAAPVENPFRGLNTLGGVVKPAAWSNKMGVGVGMGMGAMGMNTMGTGSSWGKARGAPMPRDTSMLGDFPDLSQVGNACVCCMRAVSALKKKGLITEEVDGVIRDGLVCSNPAMTQAVFNAVLAFGTPDYFSLEDLTDALHRVFRLRTQ